MPAIADRVKETTTTIGTGTLSLGGAVADFRTFISAFATGTVVYYVIDDGTGSWEVGYGTLTSGAPNTLSRTTVLSSSNAGSLVNFAAGTKNVWNDVPAALLGFIDPVTGNIKIGTIAAGGNFSVTATRTTINWHAFEDEATLNTTDTGLGYAAYDANAVMNNSLAQDHFVGYQARFTYNGSANLTSRFAAHVANINHTGTGTIVNAYGVQIYDVGGTGPITNNYGLYIPIMSRGTTLNRGAFAAGGYHEIRGKTGFGDLFTGGANPHSSVHILGSLAFDPNYYTTDRTLTERDGIALMDASAGARVATLEDAGTCAGRVHLIKKFDTSANTVTVACFGTQTIEGSATYVIPGGSRGDIAVISMGAALGWSILFTR